MRRSPHDSRQLVVSKMAEEKQNTDPAWLLLTARQKELAVEVGFYIVQTSKTSAQARFINGNRPSRGARPATVAEVVLWERLLKFY